MINAIVYTSNTGYTEKYAKLLGEKTGLPVSSLSDAKGVLPAGSNIIYLGWLMAGKVAGYKDAAKLYSVKAVCGVGMGGTGTQLEESRRANSIPAETPFFTMQGGFDMTKLHGIYKFMMGAMVKTSGKSLAKKQDRTPDEDAMLDMLLHGGDYVSVENLSAVLDWYEKSGR